MPADAPDSHHWGLPSRALGGVSILLVVLVTVIGPALVVRQIPSPATPTETVVPRPTVAPTAAVSAGVATYREAIVGLPATLNPLLATSEAERDAVRLLFAGLTRLDGTGVVVADLAERWTVGDGGKVFEFELRRDGRWHDGQPVTSRDVVFTVRLMQAATQPANRELSALWRTVRADLVDDYRVRFTLNEPYAPFLSRTTFPILPEHRLRDVYSTDLAGHEFSRRPVGAGPYQTQEGVRDGDLLLMRHDQYHGARPHIERLMLRFYADLDEAFLALRSGGVDGVASVPGDRLADLRNLPDLRVHSTGFNGVTMLLFNLRRPIFQQRELRRALAAAIDRQELIREALDGFGEPVVGPILNSSWAYRQVLPAATGGPSSGNGGPPSDSTGPALARELLARAGWVSQTADAIREREGRALTLTLTAGDSPERRRVATAIARQLRAVGVQVEIVIVPANQLLSRVIAPREFELVLVGWLPLSGDPDPYSLWHSSQSEQGYNFAGWSYPRSDELLEAARLSADPSVRRARYGEFQQLFADEVPSLMLYSPHYHLIVSDRVRQVELTPVDRPADRFRSLDRWIIEPLVAVG